MLKTDSSKLRFFNSETRQIEPFSKKEGEVVKMYTCGPTVYNFAHIGNYRTYVFEDLLRRTLLFFGVRVEQVMNLTDVEDKTIKGALSMGKSLEEYTRVYKQAFFEDLETLNIAPVEHYPAATDYIAAMIEMIENLLKKEIAYRGADGSIYYAISKFPKYGRLSHLKLDELQVNAAKRCASDEYEKESASDFALWKAYDEARDGSVFWESPFGRGRPGWHLECSAMAIKILGETIDLHVGGVDNLFPHHENEIAQSEAFSGKPFVKFWMHCEHLLVDHKKMSKSLNNFYTLRDLLAKGYHGLEVRYMLLQTHYKTQLNFTLTGLDAARHSLQRLQDLVDRLKEVTALALNGEVTGAVQPHLQKAFEGFTSSLADDLNISSALASVFDLVREVNTLLDAGKIKPKDAEDTLALLRRFNEVLGVLTFEAKEEKIPEDLQEMFEKRNQARMEKNWALADELREKIHTRGYFIEDTTSGMRLKKR